MRTLLAAAVLSLVLVASAGAANTTTFADQAGDAGAGPDVTGLTVSTDDAGMVTIQLQLANRPSLQTNDEVGVTLDLDQNPDTGSVYYGTEVGIVFEGTNLVFLRPDPDGYFTNAPAPSSLHATFANQTATFTVKLSDLGLAPNSGFNIVAAVDSPDGVDTAPDIRTFNYQGTPGTAPPALGPDTRPPKDQAFRSRGVHGKVAELNYQALDGRGMTADTIRVYKKGHLLHTISLRLDDTNPFYYYYARWQVPRKVKGNLRFCVSSVDAAGNKSNVSCAALLVK